MSRKIVICVDRGESGIYSAEWAFENVVRQDDNVALITALQVQPTHFLQATGTATLYDQLNKALQDQLHSELQTMLNYIADQLKQRDDQVETVIVLGDPRDAIIDYVAENGADLLVVGSTAKGLLTRMTVGSVSDYIVTHCMLQEEILINVRVPSSW